MRPHEATSSGSQKRPTGTESHANFEPIVVYLITLVVGGLFIRETKDHRIDTDVHPMSR
ncbi:MAG TPA: hypothetical protein VHW01_01975 [Polyangiaceae bacterium]|nr:hypothetical protein [Polyangiaceae bacterium]